MKVQTLIKATVVLLALVESGCGMQLGKNAVVGSTRLFSRVEPWIETNTNKRLGLLHTE